jgi:hypothetical protein
LSQKPEQAKHNRDLTPADFSEHPIWGWYDEDGDSPLVIPVSEAELSADGAWGHNILFISSEFTLRDGTPLQGSIGVVVSQQWTYLLEFFKGDEIFSISLNPHSKQLRAAEDVAVWLGKPVEHISPLTYTTSYHFGDGTPIAGEVDLAAIFS